MFSGNNEKSSKKFGTMNNLNNGVFAVSTSEFLISRMLLNRPKRIKTQPQSNSTHEF